MRVWKIRNAQNDKGLSLFPQPLAQFTTHPDRILGLLISCNI
jgi:hypothetical protein